MSLAMTEHQGARSPRHRWQCPSTEERGVPGVTSDDRAPRSEESPASLAMSEHRGVPGVASDVRAPRSHRRSWRRPNSEEFPA